MSKTYDDAQDQGGGSGVTTTDTPVAQDSAYIPARGLRLVVFDVTVTGLTLTSLAVQSSYDGGATWVAQATDATFTSAQAGSLSGSACVSVYPAAAPYLAVPLLKLVATIPASAAGNVLITAQGFTV